MSTVVDLCPRTQDFGLRIFLPGCAPQGEFRNNWFEVGWEREVLSTSPFPQQPCGPPFLDSVGRTSIAAAPPMPIFPSLPFPSLPGQSLLSPPNFCGHFDDESSSRLSNRRKMQVHVSRSIFLSFCRNGARLVRCFLLLAFFLPSFLAGFLPFLPGIESPSLGHRVHFCCRPSWPSWLTDT